ncbi:MAG: phosphoglycerate dehydrogenase [Acidobacteriota bacterium]|nr:phosphoglycerate dehydrogenase [Blastocatellia bacterium]MDW8411660.1 phosphoglycerate dehydrogenase [Acidobacteriota bacterium]
MKILVCGNISEQGLRILEDAGEIEVDRKPELNQEQLLAIIANYDAVIVRSETKITSSVIAAAEKLKLIGRAGSGVDNIDVKAATQRGIVVMNTPGGNTVTTAEHTMALLLSIARNVPQATASVKAGKWEKKKFQGVELFNKTLGIIGLGKIGSVVASRAQGFGMRVIAYDPFLTREAAAKMNIELVSLDDLYSRSDFITIHTPLTAETKGMIGKDAFEKMKKGVRIINCARGGLVDEAALYDAIQSGKVAAAALDVFAQEPVPTDHPLLKLDQVVCTPHLGASTEEAQINVAVAIAEQFVDFFKKGTIRGAVNAPTIGADLLEQLRPYLELGEKLGLFLAQTLDKNLRRVKIEYSGTVTEYDIKPVTQSILAGLFSQMSDRVNFVNAGIIAQERGIDVSESLSRRAVDFASLIEVSVEGSNSVSTVAGTVFGKNDIRIVKINDFHLEAIPKGHMLLCSNRDVPGVLGRLATLLGDNGINIGRLYLGRKEIGGAALVLCEIDTPVTDEIVAKLAALPDILSARKIYLG